MYISLYVIGSPTTLPHRTLFLVRASHHDKSTMGSVTKAAISFVGMLYSCVSRGCKLRVPCCVGRVMIADERVAFAQLLPPLQVGFFGYMSHYDRDIPGDILLSFSETKVAFVLKLCKLLASDAMCPQD